MPFLKVNSEHDQCRLDRFLQWRFPALGHSQAQRLVRKGEIRVDSARVRAGYVVRAGQTVRVPPALMSAQTAAAAATAAQNTHGAGDYQQQFALVRRLADSVLFAGERALVLNKPAGVATQGGTGIRHSINDWCRAYTHLSGCWRRDELSDEALPALLARFPRVMLGRSLHLTHRLDRDTSGVLVIAVGRSAARRVTDLFAARRVHKVYWALVEGGADLGSGTIDTPISHAGAGGGAMQHSAGAAITQYRLLATNGECSWLELMPLTGRKHQLRIHLATLGVPIIGDSKYGRAGSSGSALMLHARRLELADEHICPPQVATVPAHFLAKMRQVDEASASRLGAHQATER